MLNSAFDLSRRSFLGTALAGATGFLLGVDRLTGAETASRINSSGTTASDELTNLNLHEVSALVRGTKVSPVELTRACLARIESLNPLLNAFITVTADAALKQARQAESEVQRGEWRES